LLSTTDPIFSLDDENGTVWSARRWEVAIMTDAKNDAVPVEKPEAEDPHRRNLAMALIGALGGVALLEGCASPGSPEQLGLVEQSLTGTNFRWLTAIGTAAAPLDLRNLSTSGLLADQIVGVTGFYAHGDGGGGFFYWDSASTEADDGGTIIQPPGVSSGRWKRIYSGPLNVLWFGAKGTANSNDAATNSTAFSNAITAAGQNHSVYVPGGTYFVNTPVLLNAKVGFVLFGDGPAVTDITTAAPTPLNGLIELKDCYQCSVRDLSCTGPSSAPSWSAIYIHAGVSGTGANRLQNLNLRGQMVGGTAGLIDGIVINYDAGNSANNEEHVFENVAISNFQAYGFDIWGVNPLANKIIGGSIGSGPTGVRCYGGSFEMFGTSISVTDTMFNLDYSVNLQEYPVSITAVVSESTCRILVVPLQVGGDSGSPVDVVMTACHIKGAAPTTTPDVIQCDGWGKFTFVGCRFATGGSAGYKFNHAHSQVALVGCTVYATQLVHMGSFTSIGNQYVGGITESGNAATALGDFSNYYPPSANQVRLANITTTQPPSGSGGVYKTSAGVLMIA
jgi:hypothetical protein